LEIIGDPVAPTSPLLNLSSLKSKDIPYYIRPKFIILASIRTYIPIFVNMTKVVPYRIQLISENTNQAWFSSSKRQNQLKQLRGAAHQCVLADKRIEEFCKTNDQYSPVGLLHLGVAIATRKDRITQSATG
jgi:hypothetical protein